MPSLKVVSSTHSNDGIDAAVYIRELAGELKRLADGHEMAFLSYLLGMVEEEATAEASGRVAAQPTRPGQAMSRD